jgi:hypothetical protein
VTICTELAEAFPSLAVYFEAREQVGIERYGRPLDAIADARDWGAEAHEELIDAMVYLTAELHRLAELKRSDSDARYRYLAIKGHRTTIARMIEDLRRE